ncbi:MAG: sulfate adenylyltransferase subunit CysD [Fimbriimonadaceae bacterium]|nr:sulfate adenylyltransferase subunit CysD [Fimbriimonadaceae bacterium]
MRRHALLELEAEAIEVLREAAALCPRTALLFSGGKDSIVLAHLAIRAFAPAPMPFALLHIDTGHNFPEALTFRDEFARTYGLTLHVRTVQASIDAGRVQEEPGPHPSRNRLQSVTLRDAIAELALDAALGGARRDEEKARAKERFLSHRNAFSQWDPRQQRPELWRILNARKHHGEHFRIFPLSNWTELDVWEYIAWRQIDLPSLYFAHRRLVVPRGHVFLAVTPFTPPAPEESPREATVRFRTVGDATCTGAIASNAATVAEVIAELRASRLSERSTRADDQRSESAMEDRKREGYF